MVSEDSNFPQASMVLGASSAGNLLVFLTKAPSPCVAILCCLSLQIYQTFYPSMDSAQVQCPGSWPSWLWLSEHPDLWSCPSCACSPLAGPWFPITDGCPVFGLLAARLSAQYWPLAGSELVSLLSPFLGCLGLWIPTFGLSSSCYLLHICAQHDM